MKPKIITTSSTLDMELSELLGEEPSSFLILLLNGKQLDGYGTPFDSPAARWSMQRFVDCMNTRSSDSWWPEFFVNWREKITAQFGLNNDSSADDFRPIVSWEIHRVCCGYSLNLHCAIRLFEEERVVSLIDRWTVGMNKQAFVEIDSKSGKHYEELFNHPGENLSLVIGRAVKRLLIAEGTNFTPEN